MSDYVMVNGELYHYGVKGMKWGVRRYQYADGSLTPQGKRRYNNDSKNRMEKFADSMVGKSVRHLVNSAKTKATGKQYVDGYLAKGTTLARIQTSQNFEKFAFFATYKKSDMDRYMGLFGKNLSSRAQAEARQAEKKANISGSEEDILNAKALREKADGTKVYQLKLTATKKLRVPSDENVSDITVNLLKEVGLKNIEDRLKCFPHQFSGGQLQRIGIALALAQGCDLLVCPDVPGLGRW